MNKAREPLKQYAAKALTGVKGAETFARAVATGDVVTWQLWQRRKKICHSCPSRIRLTVKGAWSESDWCGQAFVDRMKDTPPTCGCLCAAKAMVKSESCPQSKW